VCGDRRVHGAVLRSVARAGVGVLLEDLFRFSGSGSRSDASLYDTFSRGQHVGDSPPRQVPPRTAPPPKSEITDMRPVLRARAARACRLRGLVAAERNELRSIGRRALSVSVICKASMMCVISQASIRQCTGN
jgi:hypothetical protein